MLILWFSVSAWLPLYASAFTHSHTQLITCTCCYDEIRGTKDQDFSYSLSDSLYASAGLCVALSVCLARQSLRDIALG
jgi:hypothetical protein